MAMARGNDGGQPGTDGGIAPKQQHRGQQPAMQERRTQADMRHAPDQRRPGRHRRGGGGIAGQPGQRYDGAEPPDHGRDRPGRHHGLQRGHGPQQSREVGAGRGDRPRNRVRSGRQGAGGQRGQDGYRQDRAGRGGRHPARDDATGGPGSL
jgi:hypothetical protein